MLLKDDLKTYSWAQRTADIIAEDGEENLSDTLTALLQNDSDFRQMVDRILMQRMVDGLWHLKRRNGAIGC